MKVEISDTEKRKRSIYRVTIAGAVINVFLLFFKFLAGIIGGSAAMISDAVHSLSDFATDIVVIMFVKISSKPQDETHDYGHGKYETLATLLIGFALFFVGVMLAWNGVEKIVFALQGHLLPVPGMIAFWAALLSIVLKEWTFRFTRKVGRSTGSPAVEANAWHHRSDALSSVGTALGVGGAIFLGGHWAVLDPIAAVVVSGFIIYAAYILLRQAVDELLEKSLSREIEEQIIEDVNCEPGVYELHNLRTRRIGSYYAIEMHIRMDGNISLYLSHEHATNIERRLRTRFGERTHIGIHVEPIKMPPSDKI